MSVHAHLSQPASRSDADAARIEDELRRMNAELSQQAAELRAVNQSLLDSEQRLRLALETGRIGLWVWNSTDVANSGDWSPRLKEIFGLPRHAEVTHEMFLECVHPEDRGRVNAGVMQALAGANAGEYRCEYRAIPPPAGELRWVTARGQAFFDAEGRAIRFIGTVMDITERKLAEQSMVESNADLERRIAARMADLERANQALMRSEDDLRVAIDTIPGLVWTSRPDNHIEYLNQRWLDFTGLRQEEASGWGWAQAIHPDDLAGLVTYWKSILAAGEPGEYEARLRAAAGAYRWFLFRSVPLRDAHGTLVKWYGTNTDIEDRRASENVARGHLDALTHLLEILGQESDPDQLPRHVVSAIKAQLGAASVTIWERNGDSLDLLGVHEEGRFRPRREAGYFEGRIPAVGHAPPLWVEALHTGAHILIEDIDKEPTRIILADGRTAIWRQADLTRPFAELKRHLLTQSVRGLLISPLLLAGRLAGIIGIRFRGTRVFGREEIELTRALAHQAMLALQMMRLSRQSRQAAVIAERNRLARDIHDTLAQGLTGVIVQLEAAEDAQTQGLAVDAAAHVERASELARDSLREARRSVHALRPRALEEANLCAALEALFQKMSAGTSLHASFHAEGQPRKLAAEVEENLLHVGQEVFTNVLRHARAAHFTAWLIFDRAALRLEFCDDGCGFDRTTKNDGFGLIGMEERVREMGGRLDIQSVPGVGTAISIVLSLPDDSAQS
jgi:PAS domain S-box-containing protein